MRDAGWLELRDDAGDGAPLAGGVEAAIVADALGGAVADVAVRGPAARARPPASGRRADTATVVVVGFEPDADRLPASRGGDAPAPRRAVDAGAAVGALVLADGTRRSPTRPCARRRSALGLRPHPTGASSPAGRLHAVEGQRRLLTDDDLLAWTALGLALTSADLVGVMRGVLDVTVAYAIERRQYGLPIGSFQAVQHLLAEARCLMEGSLSVSQHASWAVDALEPGEAVAAGRVAKAYCARAARTVCETAVQVHGGIGNTWECIVHVYLRRALLSSQWFGDDGVQLAELAAASAWGWPVDFRDSTEEAEFRARLRAWLATHTIPPGYPSRRPTTSTGPARPSGTRPSSTRGSSA